MSTTSQTLVGNIRCLLRRTGVASSTARLRGHREHDESGAILVLALVFLVAVSLIVLGLLDWTGTSLQDTTAFASERSVEYAATSATQLAIQNIRYSPLISGSASTLNTPNYCWANGTTSDPMTIDGVSVFVSCITEWNPASSATRVVTVSTCLASVTTDPTTCTATPLLQANVTFNDYPTGVYLPSSGPCVVYCGSGMTQNSWQWRPVVPSVQTVTAYPSGPAAGPINGGTEIQVSGTGFVTGTTVNLVQFTQQSPGQYQVSGSLPIGASNVTVAPGGTSLTAYSPAISTGTTYFVTVTTPGGTSVYNDSGGVFTYSATTPNPVIPVVSQITPAEGTTAGGTGITITGTGFYNGSTPATVAFTPQGGGASQAATSVKVLSPTTITATAPSQTSAGNFDVTVTTQAGTSATGAGDVFNYIVQYPLVVTVSDAGNTAPTGPHTGGTQITITGGNFLSNSTVALTPVAGGTGTAATGVTVVSVSEITAVTPARPAAGAYYVTVTTTVGGNSFTSQTSSTADDVFTYT